MAINGGRPGAAARIGGKTLKGGLKFGRDAIAAEQNLQMTDQDHEGSDVGSGMLWIVLHEVCEKLDGHSKREYYEGDDANDQDRFPSVWACHALLATQLYLVILARSIEGIAPLWRYA